MSKFLALVMTATVFLAFGFKAVAETKRLLPGQPGYQAKWVTVRANNGAAYQIDLNSRIVNGIGVEAMIYISEGNNFDPGNLRDAMFDCRGHMTFVARGAPDIYLPPLSVGAKVAAIACAARGQK
jgi:hypothetical protein